MKKLLFLLPVTFFMIAAFTPGDDDKKGKKLPSVTLKDMAGNSINTAAVSNDGKPIVVNFWATWCKPCKQELNTIADEYDDWREETGVKLVAVSVDDQKTTKSVEPYVNASGWEYDVWLDVNGDFKRALGVIMCLIRSFWMEREQLCIRTITMSLVMKKSFMKRY